MRFSAKIAACAAILVAAYFMRRPEPVEFRDRMMVRPSLATILYRRPTRSEVTSHAKSVNQSLLIRSVKVVDHPESMGAGFTFPEIGAKAFAPAGVSSAQQIDSLFRNWADTGEAAIFGQLNQQWGSGDNRTLANIPLRMLAVVNRMDLAVVGCEGAGGCQKPGKPVCTAEHLCGAEVRFVYAGVDATEAPFLTLIVEFTFQSLSKQNFRDLADRWAGLEQVADPESDLFATKLGDTLRFAWSLPGGIVARLRINAKSNDNPWKLRQYSFMLTGLAAGTLTQQFDQTVQAAGTCQSQGALYNFAVAAANHDAILQGQYQLPGEPGDYDLRLRPGVNVLTFAMGQGTPADLDAIRHSISVNSCSGCHGWETRLVVAPDSAAALEPFDQIQYRLPGRRSALSAFLAGTKNGGKSAEPTLDTWEMRPPAIYDSRNGCTTPAAEVHYNDLLRRKMLATRLQSLLPTASDNDWYTALMTLLVLSNS